MGEYDFVDVGNDFVWVDDPGYDWIDANIDVVRLRHLQAHDVSIIYGYRALIGGEIMHGDFEIYLGSSNTIDLQLTAENVGKGEPVTLDAAAMAMINGVKLALDDQVIDSAAVGLGADQPFDHVTKSDDGILSIDLGGLVIPTGAYRTCLLAVSFTNTTRPKVINLRRRTIVYPAF